MKKMTLKLQNNKSSLQLLSSLSKQRLELICLIRDLKPNSIYELATAVQKSQPFLLKEVRLLSDMGLVQIEKSKLNGRTRLKPVVQYQILNLEWNLLDGTIEK